jgi:hypothetical protein
LILFSNNHENSTGQARGIFCLFAKPQRTIV